MSEKVQFPALAGYTEEKIRELAATETPQPEEGSWVLISPKYKVYSGDSPMQCIQDEMRERVPALVALARIQVGVWDE